MQVPAREFEILFMRKHFGRTIQWAGVATLLFAATAGRADVTNASPDFKEVYDLIRAHLAGQDDSTLNRAAVQGLIDQLHTQVSLVSSKSDMSAGTQESALVQSSLYEGPVACLRIARVTSGLADKVAAACKDLTASNQLKGIVFDLRYASGHDYDAAVATANLFITKEQPLLDWGNGFAHSKENKDAIALPIVVLVNHETADAAEALAAVLREAARAVILGSPTAGHATIGRDFPLKNGQVLRIATATIKLDNGDALTAAGVKPDIEIAVKPAQEKAYFNNPFKDQGSSGGSSGTDATADNSTNRITRTHLTEADLIRERKERPGMELEYQPGTVDTESGKPMVHDPALARALDLVKGISALRQTHSP